MDNTNKTVSEIIKTFFGSEIVIPTDLRLETFGDYYDDYALLSRQLKMIVYLNAESCVNCTMMSLIPVYNLHLESKEFSKFGIVIILHSSQHEYMEFFHETSFFSYPVFYDPEGSFERLNPNLPISALYHTFLLDKNNKVVLVGSPLHNPPLWELYKSTIQKMIDNDGVFPEQ